MLSEAEATPVSEVVADALVISNNVQLTTDEQCNRIDPFPGKYSLEKEVTPAGSMNELKFYSEIKISGEDSLVVKNNINAQFYFGLEIVSSITLDNQVQPKKSSLLQIRQAQIISDAWIFVLCVHEPDNFNKCSFVFVSRGWFDSNRLQLLKTDLLDNVMLNEGESNSNLKIVSYDNLVDPASQDSLININTISQAAFLLPNSFDFRLPLLKVLKSILYHSNEVLNYLIAGAKEGEIIHDKDPNHPGANDKNPKQPPKSGGRGGRAVNYSRQSNALKNLDLNNNIYQRIVGGLGGTDKAAKRAPKHPVNIHQSEIDKADQLYRKKLANAATAAKRKQKQQEKEKEGPSQEVIKLQQQLQELRKSVLNNMNKNEIIDIDKKENKNNYNLLTVGGKKGGGQKNSRKTNNNDTPLLATAVITNPSTSPDFEVSNNAETSQKEDRKPGGQQPFHSANGVREESPKKPKPIKSTAKSKQKKRESLAILSLLQENNLRLSEMQDRINYLETRKPSNINKPIISTPLIEKHFPSQQNSNYRQNSNHNNNHTSSVDCQYNNELQNSFPQRTPTNQSHFIDPYFGQCNSNHHQQVNYLNQPYYGQVQPNLIQNWGISPSPMVLSSSQYPSAVTVRDNNHQQNNTFDYAMLDFLKGIRR